MSHRPTTEAEAVFVAQLNALAVHARLHGPAPDSAERMEAILAKHMLRIEEAEKAEAEWERDSEMNGREAPSLARSR